jgi:hypothetical protein
MPALTTDQIEQLNGQVFLAGLAGNDVSLEATDEYSDAFSLAVDVFFGTPDPKIYSPHAAQKGVHIGAALGAVLGNMWAVANADDAPGFFGMRGLF